MSAVSPIAAITARIAAIESRIGVRAAGSVPASPPPRTDGAWSDVVSTSGLGGVTLPGVDSVVSGVGQPSSVADVSKEPVSAVPFAAEFNQAAAAHDVPARLLAAMSYVESRFDTTAVSSAGAVGLMQFLPSTAAGMGVDPYDPRSAIDGAARYLRAGFDRFGSWDMAVAAYNIGPNAMAAQGAVLPGTQASKYLVSVLAAVGGVA